MANSVTKVIFATTVSAILVLVLAKNSACQVLWQDSYASGDFKAWGGSEIANCLFVDETNGADDRFSVLRQWPCAWTTQQAGFAPQQAFYIRWYVKFESGFAFGTSPKKNVILLTSGGQQLLYFNTEANGDAMLAYQYNEPASGNLYLGYTFPSGRWVCIEVYTKLSDYKQADRRARISNIIDHGDSDVVVLTAPPPSWVSLGAKIQVPSLVSGCTSHPNDDYTVTEMNVGGNAAAIRVTPTVATCTIDMIAQGEFYIYGGNGENKVWIDGQLIKQWTRLMNNELGLPFASFKNDYTWNAPGSPKAQNEWRDAFVVSTQYIGPVGMSIRPLPWAYAGPGSDGNAEILFGPKEFDVFGRTVIRTPKPGGKVVIRGKDVAIR
jgi:hypothetical protein